MQKPVKLFTDNPELLLYLDGELHITVLGGIKLTGFDRLKVTLKLVNTDDKLNVFRHNLDLYNSIQAEQLIEKSADALSIGTREISTAITGLTTSRSPRMVSCKGPCAATLVPNEFLYLPDDCLHKTSNY